MKEEKKVSEMTCEEILRQQHTGGRIPTPLAGVRCREMATTRVASGVYRFYRCIVG